MSSMSIKESANKKKEKIKLCGFVDFGGQLAEPIHGTNTPGKFSFIRYPSVSELLV